MEDEAQAEPNQTAATELAAEAAPPPKQETAAKPEPQQKQERREDRPPRGDRKDARPPRPGGDRPGGDRPGGERQGGDRPPHDRNRGDRPGGDRDRREGGGRPGGGRPFEGPPDIELEKLISDSLYLDNQAHAVVARMRDMDSGTKSQLRRLYNAVRRAVRAPESERQHQFVMLRARLAYTIARHSLRSLDALERLLLQVTRRNDAHGYERFKDLFEAIVAYNE
jgi:CRISPR type III-A-associated protein Csm2